MIVRFNDSTFRVNHRSCSEHPAGGYCMETIFDDGKVAGACPQWNADGYKATAQSLGYGDDLWRMTLEHEIAHSFLAELRGDPHSVVLWNVAHGNPRQWPPGGQAEEAQTFALMRYQQTGFKDPLLDEYDNFEIVSTGFQALLDQAVSEYP